MFDQGMHKYERFDDKGMFHNLIWFRQCLEQLKSVGIPYQIGCGLGGGDLMFYFNAIDNFAERTSIDIVIVITSFVSK